MVRLQTFVKKQPETQQPGFAGKRAARLKHSVPVLQKAKPAIAPPANGTLIVQRVLWPDVNNYFEGVPFQVKDPHNRDQVETRIVIDILKSLNLPENKIFNVIKLAESDLEKVSPLTKEYIIDYFTENGYKVNKDTVPLSPPTERFTEMAKSKEGYYKWVKPNESDFQKWLAIDDLNLDNKARLNCWEAILVTAVQAGILDKKNLRGLDSDGIQKVIRDGAATLDTTNPKNNISKGDVIVIDAASDTSWHVVMAVGANTENFKDIPIMSHYRSSDKPDSSLFAQTTLGPIISLAEYIGLKGVKYKSLK